MAMTSSRPYLVRALYEWIIDNSCTPYVLVDAMAAGVQVPQDYVKDGQIVLNIAPTAVMNLVIGNEHMTFNARFAGIPTDIHVPIEAILGIYARENGQGMIFEFENGGGNPPDGDPPADGGGKKDKVRPSLRVVK